MDKKLEIKVIVNETDKTIKKNYIAPLVIEKNCVFSTQASVGPGGDGGQSVTFHHS